MNNKLLVLLPFIFLAGCSSTKEIQSSFSDNIVVDGKHNDWGNSLKYQEESQIAFGFVNNNDYMILALVTRDRNAARKILMNGLTIWLESSEGKIGIRYPLKMDPDELRLLRNQQPPDQGGESFRIQNLLNDRTDIQVINDDEIPIYTAPAETGKDFRGKISFENEQFVYELRLPVKTNEITSRIFNSSVDEVTVNFKTGEMEREKMRGDRTGGRMGEGGMRPGGTGKRGGGRGGVRPQMNETDSSPLDYSFKVILGK